MFSFGKKAQAQEVVLQELSEEQLLQVAGGSDYSKSYSSDNDHDADDMKKWTKHKHHHHHHHSTTWKKNDHDADDKKWTSSTTSYNGGTHW
jgi:hypothetical protein